MTTTKKSGTTCVLALTAALLMPLTSLSQTDRAGRDVRGGAAGADNVPADCLVQLPIHTSPNVVTIETVTLPPAACEMPPMQVCAMPEHLGIHSDKILKRWYRIFNQQYFGGKLPDDTIVVWSNLKKEGDLGLSFWHMHPAMIELDRSLKPMQTYALLTLIHEEEHGEQELAGKDSRDHGADFQAGMLRLATDGALANLW